MSTESDKPRRYTKRRRAEQEEDTRRRITEAAVKLHGTIGPAKTTVSGIAREAGVQRATVYRHFPDENAIYDACTSHYNSLHPPPDITRWAAIADPGERLRIALAEMYAFYAETQQMLESTGRDADRVPAVAKAMEMMVLLLEEARKLLMKGRPERGRSRELAKAAIGHALAFGTWRSLVREQGLSEHEAVELMAALADRPRSAAAHA
jgi:AcrR family transcriptional regulator